MDKVKHLCVALVFCAETAAADFDPDAYPRHETCALCHGLFGVSHIGKFPNLAAQDPIYLTRQLQAFLAGKRVNDGGQMVSIVQELQPGDLENVVAWFAMQDPPAPADIADTSAGFALYQKYGCGSCHATVSKLPGVPHITAQKAQYLTKQIEDFISGERVALEGVDHQSILLLAQEEIDALTQYLSAEPRQ